MILILYDTSSKSFHLIWFSFLFLMTMTMTRMNGDGLVLEEAAVNHGHSGCRLKEGQSAFKL